MIVRSELVAADQLQTLALSLRSEPSEPLKFSEVSRGWPWGKRRESWRSDQGRRWDEEDLVLGVLLSLPLAAAEGVLGGDGGSRSSEEFQRFCDE